MGLAIKEGALDTAHAADRIHRADGGAQREARKGVAVLAFHLGGGVRVGRSHGRVDRGEGDGSVGAVLQLDDHIHDARGSVIGGGLSFPINHLLALL